MPSRDAGACETPGHGSGRHGLCYVSGRWAAVGAPGAATGFCLELSSCSFFDPREGRTREFSQEAFEVLADGIVAACAERFLA